MNQVSIQEFISKTDCSCFRLPSLNNFPQATKIILGIPWDLAVTDYPGARFAPWSIRWESTRYMGELPANLVDAGNIALPIADLPTTEKIISQYYDGYLKNKKNIFTLGGDHSITKPILETYLQFFPQLKVIHFDAHPDRTTKENGEHHGTIFTDFDQTKLMSIGLRYPHWKKPEICLTTIKEFIGDKPYYISFDIDVIDPCFAPGVSTAVPGGFTPAQILEILQQMPPGLVGADVVECNPLRDMNGNTARLCAWILGILVNI